MSGTAGPEGALDYSLGLAHARSSGFDAKASGTHNPDDDGYRSTSGSARLGYRVNAQHRIGANLLVSRLDSGYDGSPTNPQPEDDHQYDRLHSGRALDPRME